MWYLYIKAFHLVAVIAWMAALFYLPRLYVYHAGTEDEAGNERFKMMERKLYKAIANPAMMASIALGIGILFTPTVQGGLFDLWVSQGWFHAKMTLVALMLVYHFMCKYHLKQFAEDKNTKSHVYFRWFNEVPTVLLILIVILVIVKPF